MTFGGDLGYFARKTGIRMTTVTRKVSFEVMRDCVVGNPIDTGLSRSNWYVGLDRSTQTSSTANTSGAPSLARAAQFSSTVNAGAVFYITNNVHYIMELEFGHSKQAPKGWVRSTINRWQKTVDRIVREVAK